MYTTGSKGDRPCLRTLAARIVDDAAVGIYHCVNRCVRLAFLCGFDAFSNRSFDHRKLWIRRRLESLAGRFAIDVLGFAVMSNHLHLVFRNRPDVAGQWSDEEVARRWCGLFPRSVASTSPDSPSAAWSTPEGLRERILLADPVQLAECRRRLSSVSWLMRCLCEPIARAANREDEVTGRFWEGRFKCQALLDEAAVLACSMYVDLNPIRAGMPRRRKRLSLLRPMNESWTGSQPRAIHPRRRPAGWPRLPRWPTPACLPSHPGGERRIAGFCLSRSTTICGCWIGPVACCGLAAGRFRPAWLRCWSGSI